MILWIRASGKRPNKQLARLVSFIHQPSFGGRPQPPKIRVQFQGDGKYGVRHLRDVYGVELGRGVDLWFTPQRYSWDTNAFVPKGYS